MNVYYIITLGFALASLLPLASRKLTYWTDAALSALLLGVLLFKPESIDGTARYFALISAIVWLTASLYSVDYDDHYPRTLAASFSMAIAGMLLILLTEDAVTFLVGWEVMTVASYLGITAKEKEGRNAYRFLAFGELSALLILAGFGLLSIQSGSVHFSGWKGSPLWNVAFFLATLGFAVKMAIFPFHVWLPKAHGNAPANLSAQLSAVLTLMGLYGMVRMLLIQRPADWIGVFFLLFGGLTAILGAAYAAGTDHVKKLPGYSTVENDGVLLALFGGAVVALNYGNATLAAFTLLALLFFAFAHSVAKGLLFLIAGRLENGTGRFPEVVRGRLSLLGVLAGYASALSLAGIPPFPGFLGEWLGLESLLQSFKLPDPGMRILLMLVGSLVALTAGIAGVAMSKMITHGAQKAGGRKGYGVEDAGYLFAVSVLLLVGILPGFLFGLVNPTVEAFSGLKATEFLGGALGIKGGFLVVAKGFGGISPTYLFLIVSLSALGTYAVIRGAGILKTRHVRAWSGGLINPEYPPIAHSAILLVTEGWLYGTREESGRLYWKERFSLAYDRLSKGYLSFSEWFRHGLMRGSDSVYVAYILLAAVSVFLYLLWAL
ncbi:proton-conducting transporter membrane subunit [Thermococcus sp. Bubb.Bath]|uniref:proton-conducting transporter transmembrane domain-containing protein n=1 Tax=Thermococcus sp. Bubb.Bath TaxID=1638242 RepID=UPI001438F7B8|nr:proton-conducting transporter membrane subunit [Thermococcus sp. Bubb.Bath]NJF24522.1 NADH-quinone oxidoreductase subunit E [Thermococcus sp. Bubb.Bath]